VLWSVAGFRSWAWAMANSLQDPGPVDLLLPVAFTEFTEAVNDGISITFCEHKTLSPYPI